MRFNVSHAVVQKPPEATRANGLFPSLHIRIPVRRYTKPGASAVSAGTVTHPPADSHLPGLATLSRLASIAPPGAPSRVSLMSTSSHDGACTEAAGDVSCLPTLHCCTKHFLSVLVLPCPTITDFDVVHAGASNASEASFSGFIDQRGGPVSHVSSASTAVATGASALQASSMNRVSSRGGLTQAVSANSAQAMQADGYTATSAMHGEHAHATGTSAGTASQVCACSHLLAIQYAYR